MHQPAYADRQATRVIRPALEVVANSSSPTSAVQPLIEPLTDCEVRILQYLPTHLSMRHIASELYVSLNTVRTHMRHLYAKLGTHWRAETVERARALGLLPPISLPPADNRHRSS